MDDLCGVFVNDSDPRGGIAQRVAPSVQYEALENELPLPNEYRDAAMGDFGGDLRVLGDKALAEIQMSSREINNMSPESVFDDLAVEFGKVGADIWSIVDKAIDDVVGRLHQEPNTVAIQKSLTTDGAVALEKRMAIIKWMMMLNLFGYHRDTKHSTWHAAFFDGLHTATAAFCAKFITSDRRQANRAAAAFWRESVFAEVLLVRPKRRLVETIKSYGVRFPGASGVGDR